MGSGLSRSRDVRVEGTVAPGFETVRDLFEKNFKSGRESNAQLCVYFKEQKVVDLWGSACSDERFNADTLVNVFSSTKSLTAIMMAKMVEKGLLSYEEKITKYWPEFGQNGKGGVTVADLMRHEAGLAAFDATFDVEDFFVENIKKNKVGQVIEKETQFFNEEANPGHPRQYHALTRGWIANEVFRRVEPEGRTLGEVLRAEVSGPLGARAYVGIKDEELNNVADLQWMKMSFIAKESLKPELVGRAIDPNVIGVVKILGDFSKMAKIGRQNLPNAISGYNPKKMETLIEIYNGAANRKGETPSANGNCSARGLAKIAAAMANKGSLDGVEILGPAGWEVLHANPLVRPGLGWSTNFTQGGLDLIRPQGEVKDGVKPLPGEEGFYGWMGLGGSLFQWHPELRIGFAYVPTLLTWFDISNAKAKKLQKEVVKCVRSM